MTGGSGILQHYDAVKSPRGFLHHLVRAPGYVRSIARARVLVWNFFRRMLLGRFRGSFGGVFWVLVQPVFQFLVYLLVFGFLFAHPRAFTEGPDPTFAIYLFAGVLMFGMITDAASQGMTSILSNANLVKKVAFPCELLPLTPVLTGAVVYVVGCVLLLVVGLSLGQVQIGPALLLWPYLLVCLTLFSTGIALLLAAANVFVRDISQMWPIVAMAWFFSSPVFWTLDRILEKLPPDKAHLVDLLFLNPSYGFLISQRLVFGIGSAWTEEEFTRNFPHGLSQGLAAATAWALIAFFVGYGFFMSRKRKFADLV